MSQVNFFMAPEDDADFCTLLTDRDDICVLVGRFHETRYPKPASEIPPFGDPVEIQLINPDMMDPIFLASTGCGEYRGKFLLRASEAPSIEFARCSLDTLGRLVAGRIYAQTGRERAEKEAREHRNWYYTLESWIKRRYRRVDKHYWMGPQAGVWVKNGGRLALYGHEAQLCKD